MTTLHFSSTYLNFFSKIPLDYPPQSFISFEPEAILSRKLLELEEDQPLITAASRSGSRGTSHFESEFYFSEVYSLENIWVLYL